MMSARDRAHVQRRRTARVETLCAWTVRFRCGSDGGVSVVYSHRPSARARLAIPARPRARLGGGGRPSSVATTEPYCTRPPSHRPSLADRSGRRLPVHRRQLAMTCRPLAVTVYRGYHTIVGRAVGNFFFVYDSPC